MKKFFFFMLFLSLITGILNAAPIAEVKPYNGVPTLFIHGKPHMGLIYWAHPFPSFSDKEALPIYTNDLGFWTENKDPDTMCNALDRELFGYMGRDRNAHYLLRLGTQAPNWWLKENPDQRIVFDGKPVNMASYASKKWRETAAEYLAHYVDHIKSSFYADRIIGFLIGGGDAGEWAIAGDANYPDESSVNQDYFREWLKNKYKNVNSLQKAWNDQSVTFESATIPSLNERKKKDYFSFRDPSKSQKEIDFYTYWNWLTADTINYFAKVIKEHSNNSVVVGAFYGYIIGAFSPANNQRNGHAAIQVLIESPYIDFIGGPLMYQDRFIGGEETVRTIEDTLGIHNKMWFNEGDLRTFTYFEEYTKNAEYFYTPGARDSLEVIRRAFAWTTIRGNGMWWNAAGDYNNIIRKWGHNFSEIANVVPDTDRSRVDELAFIIDENSDFYMTTDNYIQNNNRFFQMMEAGRCGVPYSVYSLIDLLKGNVPKHKAYIMIDTFRLTPVEVKKLHAEFKKDNAVVVWEYAPGFVSDKGISLDNIKATTGINMGVLEGYGEYTVHLTNYSHPITSGIPKDHYINNFYQKWADVNTLGDRISTFESSVGPAFYINDPNVTVLGELDSKKLPGLGIKKMDGWTSIYSSSPSISAELMRGISKFAGIHVYSNTRDFLAVNKSWITMHTQNPGEKTIELPGKYNVYDVYNNIPVGKGISEIKFTSPSPETRLFYVGDKPLKQEFPIPDLRLALNWDTSLDADFAAGERKAIVLGNPQIVEGKFGKALHIADDNDGVGYNDAKNICPSYGTLEFWFKPDWDGTVNSTNYLFEAVDNKYIYDMQENWMSNGIRMFKRGGELVTEIWGGWDWNGRKIPVTLSWSGLKDWKAGDWHHIVLTWAPNDFKLFIDNHMAASSNSGTAPYEPLPTISIGYVASVNIKSPAKGTFDKLRIYDYPVNSFDIEKMYKETKVAL